MAEQGWTRVDETASGWTPVHEAPKEAPSPEMILAVSRRRARELDTGETTTPTQPDWKTKLGEALESAAHPQTLGDLTGLLIPGQVEGAVRTGMRYLGALKTGVQKAPSGVTGLLKVPRLSYQALSDSLPTNMTRAVEDFHGGPPLPIAPRTPPQITTGGAPDLVDALLGDARAARAAKTTTTAAPVSGPALRTTTSTSGLAEAERAALAKRGYSPTVIAKIEQQMSGAAPMPSHAPGPEFQPVDAPVARPSAPTATPAATLDQPLGLQPGFSRSDVAQAAAQMQRENPNIVADAEQMRQRAALAGPRIQTGAQRVARQAGMTTQDVRTAAGPVLDEAVGEASPILPQQALGRIIDDMKALPPGAEREAYVARATSGKTKAQVENVRRTLEHLGLIVPAAVGVREGLMQLMRSHESTQ